MPVGKGLFQVVVLIGYGTLLSVAEIFHVKILITL